jgi:hypothetical protein
MDNVTARLSTPSMSRFRNRIARLGPYPSLFLLIIPAGIVEPIKLVAVVIAGSGHWLAGTTALCVAYLVSIFFIERLFHVVKPQLLTLPWFRSCWRTALRLRRHGLRVLRRRLGAADTPAG